MPKVKIGNITFKKALEICYVQYFEKKTCEGCPLFLKQHGYGCVFNMSKTELSFVTDVKVELQKENKNDQN